MALKKTVITPQGFEAKDAYHRVENVALVGKNAISYIVRSYKQSTEVPAFAELSLTSDYDMNGANPIAQAYKNVKTLEEFSGAQDC